MTSYMPTVVVHPNIYIEKILHAYEKCNGALFAKLLGFEYEIPNVWDNPDFEVKINFNEQDNVLIENMIKIQLVMIKEYSSECPNYEKLLDYQCTKFSDMSAFVKITTKNRDWFAPVVRIISRDLRRLSIIVDDQNSRKSNKTTIEYTLTERLLDYFMSELRNGFNGPNFSIPGSLAIGNEMLQSYYIMNKYNLALSLIKSFEQNPNYNLALIEDLIFYKFLIGRFYLLMKDYKNAYLNLHYAFQKCPKEMINNKKLILTYLIPTNIRLGILPTKIMDSYFENNNFTPIVESIRTGDLCLYKNTLEKYKDYYVKWRIFLAIFECKKMVLRTLYHQTFLESKIRYKSDKLKLRDFQLARSCVSRKNSTAELEKVLCELAILIYEGYIKGYISLTYKKIVFHKENPFPSVQNNSFVRNGLSSDKLVLQN